MARWHTPGWGSPEAHFVNLIACSIDDFVEFVRHTFPVGKYYTVRKKIINGKVWILCNDPTLNTKNIVGVRINSDEDMKVIEELNHKEKRIKILEG